MASPMDVISQDTGLSMGPNYRPDGRYGAMKSPGVAAFGGDQQAWLKFKRDQLQYGANPSDRNNPYGTNYQPTVNSPSLDPNGYYQTVGKFLNGGQGNFGFNNGATDFGVNRQTTTPVGAAQGAPNGTFGPTAQPGMQQGQQPGVLPTNNPTQGPQYGFNGEYLGGGPQPVQSPVTNPVMERLKRYRYRQGINTGAPTTVTPGTAPGLSQTGGAQYGGMPVLGGQGYKLNLGNLGNALG